MCQIRFGRVTSNDLEIFDPNRRPLFFLSPSRRGAFLLSNRSLSSRSCRNATPAQSDRDRSIAFVARPWIVSQKMGSFQPHRHSSFWLKLAMSYVSHFRYIYHGFIIQGCSGLVRFHLSRYAACRLPTSMISSFICLLLSIDTAAWTDSLILANIFRDDLEEDVESRAKTSFQIKHWMATKRIRS